ncbi:SDR family NAD(P)-dependent oxidoreductase [Parvularcula sp. LCG005]|uniref:SDR family NAD(P)-dependent oxidoreductase n=1 Tax=Parvularcula sp. LCG005 TaxID=3078805 RepID=UPI002941C516|nr:SDR family NAD(P)-dependent oxidoreductase [Parvularcula sp. LCG005]WOI54349.1 SDR family NAD(P)-dependent oxidoreductase [Parvularcula sp. LCG005]
MLEGKSVVITGATGSLGRAAIEAVLLERGEPILISRQFADDFYSDLPRYEIDLTEHDATQAVISRIGDFDAVFNIAGGFAMGKKVYDDDRDDWSSMFALNTETMRNVAKVAIPLLIQRGGGAMVNVGAYAAQSGKADMGAYVASKAAVMRLTETLSEEVREHGVNVNAVLPTIIDTPANRNGMPDADPKSWVDPTRLAQVMCFLASDAAQDIHGALLPVRALS